LNTAVYTGQKTSSKCGKLHCNL